MAASLAEHVAPKPLPEAPDAAQGTLAQLAVLIPAWQPGAALPSLVHALLHRAFLTVVVIDDGSTPESASAFQQIAALPGVELLRHARNRGKGHALKTGLTYLLHTHPQLLGVITADADGQHLAADIERVARALLAAPQRPVLGVRSFAGDVPLRSRFGNHLTRSAFGLLTGARLADTQTGLRGLPLALVPELLTVPGDRYEYETAALAHLCRTGHCPAQLPIATVYLDGNRSSHFNPLWDSLRVYGALLRSARGRLRRTRGPA